MSQTVIAHYAAQQLAPLTASRRTCQLAGKRQNEPHYFLLQPVLHMLLLLPCFFLMMITASFCDFVRKQNFHR